MNGYTTRVVDAEARWSRGTFPDSWGPPPTFGDSPERRRWIAEHARRDGVANGHPDAVRALLEERREDPATRREQAAIAVQARLRREELVQLLLPAHLRGR